MMNEKKVFKQMQEGGEEVREWGNDIGSVYKGLRLKYGYTRQQLAKLVGYSTDTIKKIENGERPPSIGIMKEYHKLLHVDYNFLVDGVCKSSLESLKEQIAGLPLSDCSKLAKFIVDLMAGSN